ncbi:MAG: radical SAM protein [Bacteroidales bacterium]
MYLTQQKTDMPYPLVHLIWLDSIGVGGIYDGKMNVFVRTSIEDFKSLKSIKTNPLLIDKDPVLKDVLEKYQKYGIFSSSEKESRVENSDEFIKNLISYATNRANPRKLTLELTEECNLRCKYCRYTINEKHNSGRFHNNSKISIEIAKKAIIDYLVSYSKIKGQLNSEEAFAFEKKNPPTISFYGGEVMIEKKALKYLIDFSTRKASELSLKLRHVVTTNGTLLDEDIIDFLVDCDVMLAISFDGPQSENDKNRVYRNGKGSYEKITKSLSIIKKKYPSYALNNVTIQAVDSPNYDKNKVLSYFREESTKGHFAGVNTFIMLPYTDFENKNKHENFSKEGFQNLADHIFLDTISFFDTIPTDMSSELIIDSIQQHPSFKDMIKLAFEMQTKIGEYPKLLGTYFNTCYIGKVNLVVTPNGNYHLCERTDYSMPIGNVENGINNNKIAKIYQDYFTIMNGHKCKNCWAGLFCPICVAQLIENGKIINPEDSRCQQIRITSELYLKLSLMLSHKYQHIYEALNNYFHKADDTTLDEFLTNFYKKKTS